MYGTSIGINEGTIKNILTYFWQWKDAFKSIGVGEQLGDERGKCVPAEMGNRSGQKTFIYRIRFTRRHCGA